MIFKSIYLKTKTSMRKNAYSVIQESGRLANILEPLFAWGKHAKILVRLK